MLLTFGACSSNPKTLEEAYEMADELIADWNESAHNGCEYNIDYNIENKTCVIGPTILNTPDSEYSGYYLIDKAKSVCNEVYQELSTIFENYSDVEIYVLVSDNNQDVIYAEKDGEVFDLDRLSE